MTFYDIPPEEVWIDNFGEGANVAKEIALASGQRVNSLNVNEEAEDKERYVNKRAEAYWRLRQWMRIGADLIQDDRWKQLLTIKYRRELSGKLKIMGKREMQKLSARSRGSLPMISQARCPLRPRCNPKLKRSPCEPQRKVECVFKLALVGVDRAP